jgi:ribosomal RNA-processing protein 7
VLGKRKRQEEKELQEVEQDMRMPRTWESDLRTSGSTAVAVFMDAWSKQIAWKACKTAIREKRKYEWKGGEAAGNR